MLSKGEIFFGHFWEESVLSWHLLMEAHLHIKNKNINYNKIETFTL